ncbi:MAG: hypothetical protein KAH77_05750 [Thiomargarita sp.]|nr:hypothetical protein [Thiomargarita sp.]
MSKINSGFTTQLIFGSVFFLVLISTLGIYWTGLEGIFLFDDSPNLEALSRIDSTTAWLSFIFEGTAGALGRPVSLFTFALQSSSWPYAPSDFKYVNVMIHLFNGCLVFWFILSLSRLIKLSEHRSLLLALFTSTVWLLHPLQVSTVLYVVQRMTELSALFTLLGLIVYVKGRSLLAAQKLKTGFFWVSVGVIVGGILGTLSKENGILLVLYIIVLEFTVLHALPKARYWRLWSGIFLYLPLILLVLYLLKSGIWSSYTIRDFTLGERLLTETRILTEYLFKILLLHPYGFGLYFDDYIVSRDILTPPMTLVTLTFIISLFLIAIKIRSRFPILAFGILWFLAGHVLESSFIGLILYFEHRNYIPMLGILFAMMYGVLYLFNTILTAYVRKLAIFLIVCLFALTILLTSIQTNLWSKPVAQTVVWAEEHPRSPAAQIQAIAFFYYIGEYVVAEQYIQKMLSVFPNNTDAYLYQILLSCREEQLVLPQFPVIIQHFQTSEVSILTAELLIYILEKRKEGVCYLNSEFLNTIFYSLLQNSNNHIYKGALYNAYALFNASEKRYGLAIEAAKHSLVLRRSLALQQLLIHWLILEKRFEEAKKTLYTLRIKMNPITLQFYDKQLKWIALKIQVLQKTTENDHEQ